MMSLIPWGPISLWGPTETLEEAPSAGFRANAQEIEFLMAELRRSVRVPVRREDIVSVRCGVRPLAVRRGAPMPSDTLQLSRRYYTHKDSKRQWVTVFGGKLTGCDQLGRKVRQEIAAHHAPSSLPVGPLLPADPVSERFPGFPEAVPAAAWCAEREWCWTLEDYLRRRTNIAQWVPRGGLGTKDENRDHLVSLARWFTADLSSAIRMVDRYSEGIYADF